MKMRKLIEFQHCLTMYEAELYGSASDNQQRDAKLVMDKYSSLFDYGLKDNVKHIDIGSASGNIAIKYIHPYMPNNYNSFVITDLVENMVEFAKTSYSKDYPKTVYRVLNIVSPSIPENLMNKFDSLTCFYCFHWLVDKRLVHRKYSIVLDLYFNSESTLFKNYLFF